jgi:NAD(P)H dehydrogenase (quinone)
MNFISNEDIGEVAAICLITDGHEGKIYNFTGPDTVTYAEATTLLTEITGKKVTFIGLTEDEDRKALSSYFPPNVVELHLNMHQYMNNGGYNRTFEDLEKLTGSKGRTLRQFFLENVAAFK